MIDFEDPTITTLIILENEIAMGRKYGMAGQTLDAMCSARDELERLRDENKILKKVLKEKSHEHNTPLKWFTGLILKI